MKLYVIYSILSTLIIDTLLSITWQIDTSLKCSQIVFIFPTLLFLLIITIIILNRLKHLIPKHYNYFIKLVIPLFIFVIYSEFIRNSKSCFYNDEFNINYLFQGIYSAIILSFYDFGFPYYIIFLLIQFIYSFFNIYTIHSNNMFFFMKLVILQILLTFIYFKKCHNPNFIQHLIPFIDDSNDAYLIIDTSKQIKYFNTKITALTGHKDDKIVTTLLDYKIPSKKKTVVSSDNIFSARKDQGVEECLKDSDDIILTLEDYIDEYIIKKQNGNKINIKINNNYKEYEVDILYKIMDGVIIIRLNQDQNENSQQIITSQLSKVSHEMRTPLNAIISMLECLEKDISGEMNHNYVQPCLNSALLLISLLNDILDHAQLGKKKLLLNLVSFNLKRFLYKLTKIFQIQANKRYIKIEVSLDLKLPQKVRTDQNRLRQIIINLISNALKFTKQGGIIQLKCSPWEKGQIKLSVKDDGIGISKENQKKLFKEFGKISSKENQTMNTQGVGLGLQISQELALLLGYSGILIDSEEGEGAEFWFIIENHEKYSNENISDSEYSHQNQQAKQKNFSYLEEKKSIIINKNGQELEFEQIEQQQPGSRFQRPSFSEYSKSYMPQKSIQSFKNLSLQFNDAPILIIDDNEFNVMALKFQLEKLGIKADFCYSGNEALAMIREKSYKLIFMDIEMPQMDGYETTKQILQFDSQILIIGCTGYTSHIEKSKCMSLGMVDLIEKPVQNKLLKQLLKKLIMSSKII